MSGPSPNAFDAETAISPRPDGGWDTSISDKWSIGENPNGGYLVSPVLRAMRSKSAHPDPLTVTTHFLRPGTGGAAGSVSVDVIRKGRTLTTLSGSLSQVDKATQADKGRLQVLAAFGDLSSTDIAGDSPLSLTVPPPDLPPPDVCPPRLGSEQGILLGLSTRIETRLHPDQAMGGQAGAPVVTGWIRFVDRRDPDAASLVLFADAFPPAMFGLYGADIGWVPTIELTVHVRRRPAPGWVCGRFTCADLADGRLIEDGMLWDSDGNLVAESRQIGLLLP